MLRWYVNYFDTVEINNSFYRLPTDDALKIWFDKTPARFCFTVKASRYITHRKRLLDPESTVKNFLLRIEKLGRKLGPILLQLPSRWRVNLERLEQLLQVLPETHQYAFEFRDPSWHDPSVYALLRRFNAAFCIFEIARFQSPIEITTDFSYVRLHGSGERAIRVNIRRRSCGFGQSGLHNGRSKCRKCSFTLTTTRQGSRPKMHRS
jgi:uncharacterized protein YecE (DUF72 family)